MQTIRQNLFNGAPTQYTNFNYTSMCRFQGVTLGAGPEGLCRACCGTDDKGVNIDAYFIPATSDFEVPWLKHMRYIYVSHECTGSLAITVTGDDSITQTATAMISNTTRGQQRKRVTIPRVKASVYYTVKIANVNGAYFAVDSINALFYMKKHGLQ